MYEDQQKWERFRDAPSSDQRLRRSRDHEGGPPRSRAWIAIAVVVALVGMFVLIVVTDGGPTDPETGSGAAVTVSS